jgi:arginine decarboxylase
MDTVTLAEQTNLTARLLEEYGERAALFDDAKPLPEQELVARATQQQFYTVLLADDSPVTSPDGLTGSLHALRLPTDDVQYQILRVTSVEDAITAVALNGEIQAAIIRHDLALRSHDRLPLMSKLLGVETIEVATDRTYDWVECGQWIRELRPRIDLYLLTDEIGCRPG